MVRQGSLYIMLGVRYRHCTNTSGALNTLFDCSQAADMNGGVLLTQV